MPLIILCFLLSALFSPPALAQGVASPGMQSLNFEDPVLMAPAPVNAPSVTAPAAPVQPDKPSSEWTPKTLTLIPDDGPVAPLTPVPPAPSIAPAATGTSLDKDPDIRRDDSRDDNPTTDPQLWPMNKLRVWDVRRQIYAGLNDGAAAKKILATFEQNPGRASPHDLLLMAQLYQQQGQSDRAATLYYAAQLRHRFDEQRFPRRPATPLNLVADVQTLGAWATESSERLKKILEAVESFDEKTPYAYRPVALNTAPARDMPEPPVDAWPEILEQTRTDFYAGMSEIITALARMGR